MTQPLLCNLYERFALIRYGYRNCLSDATPPVLGINHPMFMVVGYAALYVYQGEIVLKRLIAYTAVYLTAHHRFGAFYPLQL